MRDRCFNPEHPLYEWYGARGIEVCDAWVFDFEAFLRDVGPRPHPKWEIDRIDNNGNYEPGNVRWTDPKTQARNRRSTRYIEFEGERLSMVEWAERTGLHPDTIKSRLNLGWSPEKALTTPARKRTKKP